MPRLFLILLFFPFTLGAADPFSALQRSVHRNLDCASCHSGKTVAGKAMAEVRCSNCHAVIFEEYTKSVHGTAVARGNSDAPACTDCHGEHSILPPLEKLSQVYPTHIAETTCPQCHANERILAKYNLPTGKVESFRDTYHGLAGKIGDVKVAHCASCHGVHNILPSSDPRSTIHPANVVATCGKCHPNAGENFVKGAVHGYGPEQPGARAIRTVNLFYIGLIALVVGGYLFHNGLDYLKKLKAIYRRRRREPFYPRMNRSERVQHLLLLVSFVILVITGFALKFGWTLPFTGDAVNTFLRSTLHRISGVVMTGVLVYNLAYFFVSRRGREIRNAVLPRRSDLKEALEYLQYLTGRRPHKPRFGRFTYWEKMEYWSVLWGGIVMGVTGILMWFENWSLIFLPKWGLDLATLVHYLEAILATLAIVLGHLYFVILNPDVSPMSFTWLLGRIPKEFALEEHPREYEGRTAETEPERIHGGR